MEEYFGVIKMFAGNYAPQDYMLCQGQLLSVQQYQALFSIIGVMYGGDGVNTFGLSDLRGRAPISMGSGPGLSTYTIGQKGGSESVTLTQAQMPAHNHPISVQVQIPVNSDEANTDSPEGAYMATSGQAIYNNTASSQGGAPNVTAVVGPTGSNQPFDNRQPYIAMNYIICVNGLYPPRP